MSDKQMTDEQREQLKARMQPLLTVEVGHIGGEFVALNQAFKGLPDGVDPAAVYAVAIASAMGHATMNGIKSTSIADYLTRLDPEVISGASGEFRA